MSEASQQMPAKPAGVARSAAVMGIAAAVSRGFGAVRVLAIAAILGTTYLGNTFQSSNTVSNVLFELLAAGALSAVLVPSFVTLFEAGENSDAETLASELLGLATMVLGVVALVGVAASGWLAKVLTSAVEEPGIAQDQRHLTQFLLWFFIPQVVLYGLGAISTAVLNARRSFVVPALAPIGNTVVMVGFLVAFRMSAGADPGLELSTSEKVLLGLGGTLGVVAFVAWPTIALLRSGFALRLKFSRTHAQLGSLLRLSGWAGLQHAFAAMLLGAAIIAGGAVEGGVVAYQVGWYFFLAPYGIISQPLHTTILPELVRQHGSGDIAGFKSSIGWSLDSMFVLLAPITALCVSLSVPAMSVLAFGSANRSSGVSMLAAALASLAIGLVPYGAFFLLARVFYVYGDSRTPAFAGALVAVTGVVVMALSAWLADGTSLVFMLGIGHSAAFAVGALTLLVRLRGRLGSWALPTLAGRSLVAAGLSGIAAWVAYEAWSPHGKPSQVLALLVLSTLVAVIYLGFLRLTGINIVKRLPLRRRGSGTDSADIPLQNR